MKSFLANTQDFALLSVLGKCVSIDTVHAFYIAKTNANLTKLSNQPELIDHVCKELTQLLRYISGEDVSLEEVGKVFTVDFFNKLGIVALSGIYSNYQAIYLYTQDGSYVLYTKNKAPNYLPFRGLFANAVNEKTVIVCFCKHYDLRIVCSPVAELSYWGDVRELDEHEFNELVRERYIFLGVEKNYENNLRDLKLLMESLGGITNYQTTGKQLIARNATHYIQVSIALKEGSNEHSSD